jgi:hypothetical protein
MNQSIHVQEKITGYALGLVSENEYREIALHLSQCPECQQALHQERQIGLDVRETLSQATQPDRQRLRQLMPPIPKEGSIPLFDLNWGYRFALVGLLLMLILGALGLQSHLQADKWIGTSPAIYSTAAIVTDTPTLTLSATREGPEPVDTVIPTPVVRNPLSLPHPAIMPVPAAPMIH